MHMTDHPRLTGGDAAPRLTAETQATALLADWFAHLLLAPIDTSDIRQLRMTKHSFVIALGQALDREATVDLLLGAVDHGTVEEIETRLSRDYVRLFEGVAGPKSISLYESSYCGEGPGLFNRPFVEMQDVLRMLDIRVDGTCREPPDHLAIELAAFAKALRLGRPDVADELAVRLRGWVPSVAAAVAPHGGFYLHLFALLDAFLSLIASPAWPLGRQAPRHHEAHHVHG